ncbi:UNVERIFIED_CONTAM: hypothetical protein FKN15_069077 [Acipenser sinensis]
MCNAVRTLGDVVKGDSTAKLHDMNSVQMLPGWLSLLSQSVPVLPQQKHERVHCEGRGNTRALRCLYWERGVGENWEDWETLRLPVQGKLQPPHPPPAPAVKESHGKRKRGMRVKEEEGGDEENACPNSPAPSSKRTTPRRRVKPAARASQTRLFEPTQGPGKSEGPPASTAPASTAGTPSGRWGQALCSIGGQTALLIGGQGSRMQFCKDPMWKLHTETCSWVAAETVATAGPTPECRIGHTATFDPETERIYVFGGSKNKKWFNDVHILATKTWRWSTVEAMGKVPPLAYHSTSLFRGELFVFGGVFPMPHPEPDGCSDSLYIFDPQHEIWYQPIVLGEGPAARSGHSACLIQRKLYVFGGWDTPVCFNDMHILDLGLMEFSKVDVSGAPPSPRSWHACATLSDSSFVIHGGYDGNIALKDSFIFNTVNNSWTALVHPILSALPRAGHSMVTLTTTEEEAGSEPTEEDWRPEPRPHTLLIFGGGDNEGGFYSDTMMLPIDEVLDQ